MGEHIPVTTAEGHTVTTSPPGNALTSTTPELQDLGKLKIASIHQNTKYGQYLNCYIQLEYNCMNFDEYLLTH